MESPADIRRRGLVFRGLAVAAGRCSSTIRWDGHGLSEPRRNGSEADGPHRVGMVSATGHPARRMRKVAERSFREMRMNPMAGFLAHVLEVANATLIRAVVLPVSPAIPG